MTVAIKNWSNNLLIHVPGAPYPAMYDAIRKAAREFCKRSHLWTTVLDLIDVDADTADYTLTIPTALYAELEMIPQDGVSYKENGQDGEYLGNLDCLSEAELDRTAGRGWRYEEAPAPSGFLMGPDKTLRLYPIPDTASTEGLQVTVVLKPSRTCTTLPDFLYNDHEQTIEHGALAELFGRKGMSWYDPQAAAFHAAEFRNGYNEAKLERFTGRTNKQLDIQMRYFV